MSNNKSNDDNLLREVIGDYKNDQKTQKNLNEEGESCLLYTSDAADE